MKNRRFLIFSILLIALVLCTAGELSAMGNRESRLDEARQLIEERRYNDAVELLSQIMKEDPRKFEEAEKLINEVRKARQEYNDIYAQLIETLDIQEGETLNEQEAYDIIKELEELDANPNLASIEAFSQARRSIIFTVNDQRFQQIMNDAAELLDAEEYPEAMEIYLTGFGLHRDLFEEDGYPQAIESQIDRHINAIRTGVEEYQPLYSEYMRLTAYEDLNGEGKPTDWGELQSLYTEMYELWEGFVQQANAIEQIRLSIIDTDTTDIPFLSTLRVLTRGRTAGDEPVGIAAAVERPLVESLQTVSKRALQEIETSFQRGKVSYTAGERNTTREFFGRTISLADNAEAFYQRWRELHNQRAVLDISRKIGPSVEETQSDSLYLSAMREVAQRYIDLLGYLAQISELQESGLESEDPQIIEEYQQNVTLILKQIEEESKVLAELRGEYDGYPQRGVEVGRSVAVIQSLQEEYTRRMAQSETVEGELLVKVATLQCEPLEAQLNEDEAKIDTARDYVEGVEEAIVEGSNPVVVRYPNRSIDLVQEVRQSIQEAAGTANDVLQRISQEDQYIQTQDQVVALKQRANEFLDRIAALRRASEEITADATDLNRQADIALTEGDIRLQQARNELSAERFEIAREKLEQAGNSYSTSLSYREDPEVRQIIDQEIPDLADQIIFRQNQVIVREVRNLINRGRELFFQENFIEAEQVFTQAQSRWRQTHTEDDPEISLWQTRVARALDATSGIIIEEADPLYADMMQVLNLAKEDYQRGVELYESGDRTGGLEYFRSSEKKIEYIKEPFPNNRDAGVLYLRILEYTQPQDFESIFRGRFQDARELLDTAPEEAYRELQVLQEIKPDYPGLDDAMYEAEIATGIRQPPPDPAVLARARELYSQADRIVQQDVRAQFPIALTYLNEAIKLDPDYQEAIVLKDRIQTGQGGQVSVVLSSVDQQKLRQAENLFIDGRYFEASALIEQLWSNPNNRSNPKLVDLRRRIQSQL